MKVKQTAQEIACDEAYGKAWEKLKYLYLGLWEVDPSEMFNAGWQAAQADQATTIKRLQELVEKKSEPPKGWKLVPIAPTRDMLIAGATNYDSGIPFKVYEYSEVGEIYRDMVSAISKYNEESK